jgi:hypothetical protein
MAYLLLLWYSQITLYMWYFFDPHQGNDDFAFFFPTSNSFMWSSGRVKNENILALHIL